MAVSIGEYTITELNDGTPGENGASLYTWTAFASDSNGADISLTYNQAVHTHIGHGYNKSASAPPAPDDLNPSDFTGWTPFYANLISEDILLIGQGIIRCNYDEQGNLIAGKQKGFFISSSGELKAVGFELTGGAVRSGYDASGNPVSGYESGFYLGSDGMIKARNAILYGKFRSGLDETDTVDARFAAKETIGVASLQWNNNGLNDLMLSGEGDVANSYEVKINYATPVYNLRDTGPAGGHIFYKSGTLYYESAPIGAEVSKAWGPSEVSMFGAAPTSTAFGTGEANTTLFSGADSTYAPGYCLNLSYGGVSDWFLPSRDEAIKMHQELKAYGIGSFFSDEYSTSSDSNPDDTYSNFIYYVRLSDGYSTPNGYKIAVYRVRPARSFVVGDTFQWRIAGGTWSTAEKIEAGKSYVLSGQGGLALTFGHATGHTGSEVWTFTQSSMFGISIKNSSGNEYLKSSNGVLEVDQINTQGTSNKVWGAVFN